MLSYNSVALLLGIIRDARHGLVDVPSRPRSRLMNAYSGTKLATARIRLRSLSADGVQWVLQEHLPGHVGLFLGFDTHASGGTFHLYTTQHYAIVSYTPLPPWRPIISLKN